MIVSGTSGPDVLEMLNSCSTIADTAIARIRDLTTQNARLRDRVSALESGEQPSLMYRLAEYLMEFWPDQINPELGEVDAVSVAIRVMEHARLYTLEADEAAPS